MQTLVQYILMELKKNPAWDLPDSLSATDPRLVIRRANHKWLVFVFSAKAKEPHLVIKVPMSLDDTTRIDQEYNSLCQLRDAALPVNGIPSLFTRMQTTLGTVLVLPFAQHTTPMHIRLSQPVIRYSKHRWLTHLDRAAAWLLHFQKITRCSLTDEQKTHYQHKMLTNTFTPILATVQAGQIPLTAQHGDFNPANILIDKDDLLIIDWEWMQWPGLPLVDLFNLALRSTMLRNQLGHTHHAQPSTSYIKQTFEGNSLEAGFTKKWICRFQEGLDISEQHTRDLFECFAAFVTVGVPDA